MRGKTIVFTNTDKAFDPGIPLQPNYGCSQFMVFNDNHDGTDEPEEIIFTRYPESTGYRLSLWVNTLEGNFGANIYWDGKWENTSVTFPDDKDYIVSDYANRPYWMIPLQPSRGDYWGFDYAYVVE